MESRMRGNPHVRFGKRVGRNRKKRFFYGAPDPTSRNLRPSKADELLTQKIKQAAGLLDILVMDHIIVSDEGYFSFADEGML